MTSRIVRTVLASCSPSVALPAASPLQVGHKNECRLCNLKSLFPAIVQHDETLRLHYNFIN
jgi:hypothetical protein